MNDKQCEMCISVRMLFEQTLGMSCQACACIATLSHPSYAGCVKGVLFALMSVSIFVAQSLMFVLSGV